jgi:hypothetical protein
VIWQNGVGCLYNASLSNLTGYYNEAAIPTADIIHAAVIKKKLKFYFRTGLKWK